MTRRRLRLSVALTLAGVVALTGCAPPETQQSGEAIGAGYTAGDGSFTTWTQPERPEASDVVGTDLEGQTIDLAQLRGDVVVLNFWYAACPPCRAEAPDLNEFALDYGDQGVHMIGVNPRDDVPTAQAFERSFETPYPSIHDSDASTVASFESLVPLQAMPTTLVLDREGKPAARILGRIDPTVLRGLVDDVLAEEPASA